MAEWAFGEVGMITAAELREMGAILNPTIPNDAQTHYECDYEDGGVVVRFLLFDEEEPYGEWCQ